MERYRKILLLTLCSILWIAAHAEPTEPPHAQPGPIPWLGVDLKSGTDDDGLVVRGVFADSPGDQFGLRGGDRVVGVDDTEAPTRLALQQHLREKGVDAWVRLKVIRHQEALTIQVQLGARPKDRRGLRYKKGWIGISCIPLTPGLRQHFGAPENSGVMISAVSPNSPATAAGFAIGDVLFEINGSPVTEPVRATLAMTEAGVGNLTRFKLMRDGVEVCLEARVGEESESDIPRQDS